MSGWGGGGGGGEGVGEVYFGWVYNFQGGLRQVEVYFG